MKAVVFNGPRSLGMEERPDPSVSSPDDVVVEVALTGVCGTDRGIYFGKFPARPGVILGHEAVGTVRDVGPDVEAVAPGDRVVIDPTLHCGWCVNCREGRFNFCKHKVGSEIGVDRDGSFARCITLPQNFMYRLPEDMSFERAVFVEPLACVLNNTAAASLSIDDSVLVLGAGPIGMIAAMVARRTTSRVTVLETHPGRISLARKHLDHVIDASAGDPTEAILASLGGTKPRLIIETTGVLLEPSLDWIDDGGRIALMGFDSRCEATIKPLFLTNHGIRIIGAGDYNRNLPAALHLIEDMPLENLITHRQPLADFQSAFDALDRTADPGHDEEVMKVVFEPHPA